MPKIVDDFKVGLGLALRFLGPWLCAFSRKESVMSLSLLVIVFSRFALNDKYFRPSLSEEPPFLKEGVILDTDEGLYRVGSYGGKYGFTELEPLPLEEPVLPP